MDADPDVALLVLRLGLPADELLLSRFLRRRDRVAVGLVGLGLFLLGLRRRGPLRGRVQRRPGLPRRSLRCLGELEAVAPGAGFLGGEQRLLHRVEQDARADRGAGDREARVRTPMGVHPDLGAELDEALLGVSERGELQPGRLRGRLVVLRVGAEDQAVPGQHEAAANVADTDRDTPRERGVVVHGVDPS